MALLDFLFGSGDKLQKVQTMSREQQGALSNLFSQLGLMGQEGGNYNQSQNYLSELLGGGQESYDKFAAPYMRQFNEQTIPGISERFAGANAQGGGLSSSGFGQSLGAAGAGLQDQLAHLREGLRSNAATSSQDQYRQLLGLGLGTQANGFQSIKGRPGLFQQLLGASGGVTSGGLSGLGGDIYGGAKGALGRLFG